MCGFKKTQNLDFKTHFTALLMSTMRDRHIHDYMFGAGSG